jgi:GntR family transcriptional regulator
MTLIDRHSFIPLYFQLAQILRSRIKLGDLPAGKDIPSERDLMKDFALSRNTVRQALAQLESEGLIVRTHGSGTRVASLSNSYPYFLHAFFENRDLLLRAGYTPDVNTLSVQLVPPPEAVRLALLLDTGVKVVQKELIFFADGRPAMYTLDYMLPSISGEYDMSPEGAGFLNYLDRAGGRRVEYVAVELTPVEATGEIASRFNCHPGSPLLLMKETFLDESQKLPIAFSMNYFNRELISFRLLTRRGE